MVKLLTDKGALHELSIFTKRCTQLCTTPFPIRSKQKFGAVPGLGHDYNHRPKVPVTHTWDGQAVGHTQRAWFESFPPRSCTALSSQGWQTAPSSFYLHLRSNGFKADNCMSRWHNPAVPLQGCTPCQGGPCQSPHTLPFWQQVLISVHVFTSLSHVAVTI